MESIRDIWSSALSLLEKEVGEAPYETFIKPLVPVSVDYTTNVFVLMAKDSYAKERLTERHKHTIEMSIKDVCGKDLSCEFVLQEKKEDISTGDREGKKELLESTYTFDNFIIGKSNSFAQAVAMAVAKAPGIVYNPLFIYGGAGLGKTHLVKAIANYMLNTNSESNVLYVTSETFTNEMVMSIKNNKQDEFRNKFRNVDALIIDDIQFLINKEATQEEFFHTFNDLYNNNKQIVITSDRLPKDMQNFDDRLKSRFSWSIMADITSPDIETRNAILLKKAEEMKIEINEDISKAIEYIAERVQFNVRELEGALTRVVAQANAENKPVTAAYAKTILKNIYDDNESNVTIKLIKEEVCSHFGITVEELISSGRSRKLAYPRQIAMYLSRELTKNSLPKIGEEFMRDHTTVMHAHSKIEADMKINENLKAVVMELINKLKG